MPLKDRITINESAIREQLSQDARIESAYLLGSAARGTMRSDSDVDIAILPRAGIRIGDLSRLSLAADLSFASGLDIDIGILSAANLVYAREAILTGRRIFSRNGASADAAVATLLSMYASFNEERREVLDAYRA